MNNETRALQTIEAISAPSTMHSQLESFMALIMAAKVANNVPNYCKDDEKEENIFRYIVAFKQCYLVRGTEYEPKQGNRKFHKVFKAVETVERPSKANEDEPNFLPLLTDEKEAILHEGKEVYEMKVEYKFTGWKEIRVVKANFDQPTEKILLIVFDAPKGLTVRNIMLYAIDALAKKVETAAINGKALIRKSSEIHAFIPENVSSGKQLALSIDTMKTGGGVPARFLTDDLSKFCDLFIKKIDRLTNGENSLKPAISAKLEK